MSTFNELGRFGVVFFPFFFFFLRGKQIEIHSFIHLYSFLIFSVLSRRFSLRSLLGILIFSPFRSIIYIFLGVRH